MSTFSLHADTPIDTSVVTWPSIVARESGGPLTIRGVNEKLEEVVEQQAQTRRAGFKVLDGGKKDE